MADAGLFGLPFPTKYGGGGAGEMGYCILMEEIARASSAIGVIVGAHIGIGSGAIYLDGSEEQKAHYMPALCRATSWPPSASPSRRPAPMPRTSAPRRAATATPGCINGTKLWASNGSRADVLSVFAANDRSMGARGGITAFIVEKAFGGVTVARLEEKMGLHGSDTALLIFENVPRAARKRDRPGRRRLPDRHENARQRAAHAWALRRWAARSTALEIDGALGAR